MEHRKWKRAWSGAKMTVGGMGQFMGSERGPLKRGHSETYLRHKLGVAEEEGTNLWMLERLLLAKLLRSAPTFKTILQVHELHKYEPLD